MNHYRADHTVNVTRSGYNVRLNYKGYIISLASDGEDTLVWHESDEDETYHSCVGTTGLSVRKCMDFVDNLIEKMGV